MMDNVFERMHVIQGDITALDVDAIVNAANEALSPGGGVCGAIHGVAGPELAIECAQVGPCATGEARITSGYNLKARHVIHAVGPVWHGGGAGEEDALASAYRSALELARDAKLASIAFPVISTGIFGFPAARAAAIAVAETAAFLSNHPHPTEVIFCCFSPESMDHHKAALARLAGT